MQINPGKEQKHSASSRNKAPSSSLCGIDRSINSHGGGNHNRKMFFFWFSLLCIGDFRFYSASLFTVHIAVGTEAQLGNYGSDALSPSPCPPGDKKTNISARCPLLSLFPTPPHTHLHPSLYPKKKMKVELALPCPSV